MLEFFIDNIFVKCGRRVFFYKQSAFQWKQIVILYLLTYSFTLMRLTTDCVLLVEGVFACIHSYSPSFAFVTLEIVRWYSPAAWPPVILSISFRFGEIFGAIVVSNMKDPFVNQDIKLLFLPS